MLRNYHFIISLSLAFLMAEMLSAQPLTSSANAPRTGDVLRMQQTEYVNTSDGGENRVWDLSGIEVVNPRHRARVLAKRDSADAAADTVMTIENRMRRYAERDVAATSANMNNNKIYNEKNSIGNIPDGSVSSL